jgi:hypothetical protein
MSDWGYIPYEGYYDDLRDTSTNVPIEYYGGDWFPTGDGMAISAAVYEEMQHQAYLAAQSISWLDDEVLLGSEQGSEYFEVPIDESEVGEVIDLHEFLLLLAWDL